MAGRDWHVLLCAGTAAIATGCAVVSGIDDLEYDLEPPRPASSTATSGAGSTGGNGFAASSGDFGVGGAQTPGAGGMGGGGGEPTAGSGGSGGADVDVCGDGVIGGVEECDDQNADPDDGCDTCLVVCSGAGEFEDPITHHCYYLSSTVTTWSNADDLCAARGSTLAAPSSQAEQDFIEPHLVAGTNTWIAAHDPSHGQVFVWANGEPWSYTHWLPGKPDNGAGNEYCVKLDDNGYWDDNSCGKTRRYLCERAPASIVH